MNLANGAEPKSTLTAQKCVPYLHKTFVKPSCAAFISQIMAELCRVVAESLFPRLYAALFGICLLAYVQLQLVIKLL